MADQRHPRIRARGRPTDQRRLPIPTPTMLLHHSIPSPAGRQSSGASTSGRPPLPSFRCLRAPPALLCASAIRVTAPITAGDDSDDDLPQRAGPALSQQQLLPWSPPVVAEGAATGAGEVVRGGDDLPEVRAALLFTSMPVTRRGSLAPRTVHTWLSPCMRVAEVVPRCVPSATATHTCPCQTGNQP